MVEWLALSLTEDSRVYPWSGFSVWSLHVKPIEAGFLWRLRLPHTLQRLVGLNGDLNWSWM